MCNDIYSLGSQLLYSPSAHDIVYGLDGGRSGRARVRAWVGLGGGGGLRNDRLCSPGAGTDACRASVGTTVLSDDR